MPKPIKWNGIDGGGNAGVKEMSAAEIDDNVDLILDYFSGMTSVNTGHLAMNTDSGWTTIGTFADTRRDQAIGTHPANTTIHTDNYVFRQNLTDLTPSPTARPMSVKYASGSYDGMIEMTDAQCRADIVDRINLKIAGGGVGSYVLQATAPSTGTWTQIGANITNKHQSGIIETTKLWKRTTGSNTTATRLLKWDSSNSSVKEMTDAEIKDLVEMYQESIVDTGIGKYVLATSAPGTGTWQAAGSGFSDTRKQRGNVAYTGYYSGNYSGSYTGSYAGSRAKTYSGAYSGAYGQAYGGTQGNYSGYIWYVYFVGYFTGYYTGSYTGYYSGNYSGSYTGTYTGAYTGYYTGATILSSNETASTMTLWLRTA